MRVVPHGRRRESGSIKGGNLRVFPWGPASALVQGRNLPSKAGEVRVVPHGRGRESSSIKGGGNVSDHIKGKGEMKVCHQG